jgi:hypothetical protein
MASASDTFVRHAAGVDPALVRQRVAKRKTAPKDVIGGTVAQGAEYVGAGLGFLYGGGPGGAMAGRSAAKTLTGGVNQAGRGDVVGGAANVGTGLVRGSTIATGGPAEPTARPGGVLPTPAQYTPVSLAPQRLVQPKGTVAQAASAGAGLGGGVAGQPVTGGAAPIAAAAGVMPLAEQGIGALQKSLGGTGTQLPTTVGQGTQLSQGELAELIAILS